jgi:hypothetical protein
MKPPPHYNLGVEPWQAMRAWMTREQYIGFLRGNCIKYLARMGHKDAAAADAEKVLRYAEELVRELGTEQCCN